MRTRILRTSRGPRIVTALGGPLIAILANALAGQTKTDSARADRHAKTEAHLAKEAQDPAAHALWPTAAAMAAKRGEKHDAIARAAEKKPPA